MENGANLDIPVNIHGPDKIYNHNYVYKYGTKLAISDFQQGLDTNIYDKL